jgi:hypothetical protein
MKHILFSALLTVVILTGCDNTYDFIKEINVPPVLYINSSNTTNDFTDSLKISFKTGKLFYAFALTGVDPQSALKDISFNIQGSGTGTLSMGTQALTNNLGTVKTGQQIDLTFATQTEGNYIIRFTGQNGFGNTANATLNLFVFRNLIPIASFVAARSLANGNYAYLFDASKSYDQDRDFNGAVKNYQYIIVNNTYGTQTILDNKPSTLFVFPGPGSYSVSLIVYDNDGAPSVQYNLPSPIVVQ